MGRSLVAMMHLLGNKNVSMETDCPPNLVVEADRMRLMQVMLNLGNNSLHCVHVQAGVVNGNVRLCLEDSGLKFPCPNAACCLPSSKKAWTH